MIMQGDAQQLLGKRKRARSRSSIAIVRSDNDQIISAPSNILDGKAASDAILGQHVVKRTRDQYRRGLTFIENYCNENISGSCGNDGKLILPMSLLHLEKFLGNMSLPREDGSVKSASTLSGYASVIKFVHKESRVSLSEEIKSYLSQFHKGYKRTVASKKNAGLMKNFEGKIPITFMHYSVLCRKALFASASRSQFSSYVHAYMILCWNLFARSCSVSDLRTHHFNWENDSLVVDMSKHKADQTGEKITPKHVFANPWNPEICPILALALHVFAVSFRPDNDAKSLIFLGTPYEVFTKWLTTALSEIPDLGFNVSDFGTHSFRKGITSFCAGFIGGPSVIAIFLRAGWSLGQVQDRYITYSDGGDQLCGRVATGLNFNEGSRFAVLPPHFSGSDVLTDEEWNIICPSYRSYDAGFQSCLPYLLASLVWHWNWVTEKNSDSEYRHIASSHPILQSRLLTSGMIPRLRSHVIAPITTGRCEITGMTASGIPPHIDLQRKMEILEAENLKLRTMIGENHEQLMTSLPQKVTQNIIDNVNIQGVQQLSRNDFVQMFEDQFRRWSSQRESETSSTANTSTVPTNSNDSGYRFWSWGGKLRPVPENWSMPKGTVKAICDLFFTGQPQFEVRPFRLISTSDLSRKYQCAFAKAQCVFNYLKERTVSRGLVVTEIEFRNLSSTQWDPIFDVVFTEIINTLNEHRANPVRNAGELKYCTFYDMLNELRRLS
jgi:hypothetical protein